MTDTTIFLTMKQSPLGILFEFPIIQGEIYYTFKNDSTFEKKQMPSRQSVYGPYKFKKVEKKILFLDKSISPGYRDLYNLSDQEHYSPDLFSSNTAGYIILNTLIDSSALLTIGNTKVSCFKFFQVFSGHNPIYDKYYKILFLDKANLLPCRIESYSDKECTKLESTIFLKTYEKL